MTYEYAVDIICIQMKIIENEQCFNVLLMRRFKGNWRPRMFVSEIGKLTRESISGVRAQLVWQPTIGLLKTFLKLIYCNYVI